MNDFELGLQIGRQQAANVAESMAQFAVARAILAGGDDEKLAAIFAQRDRTVVFAREATATAARLVGLERQRQEAIYPGERLVDGTGGELAAKLCAVVRQWCDAANGTHENSFALVLVEEVLEALAETEPEKLRGEVVQIGAVACKWLEDLQRRQLAAGDVSEHLGEELRSV